MSIVEVKVPQLSESVAEATLLQWKKKPGEAVEMDEILVEIETDKVVLEVPAPAAGVLGQIIKGDGATVVSGEVIAAVDTAGKASAPAPAQATAPAAAAKPTAPAPAAAAGVAMPAAAKRMADAGLPPGSVAGTGKDGRVTKGDVLGALAAGATAPAPTPLPVAAVAKPGELAVNLLVVGLPEESNGCVERLGEFIARHRTFGQAGKDRVAKRQDASPPSHSRKR